MSLEKICRLRVTREDGTDMKISLSNHVVCSYKDCSRREFNNFVVCCIALITCCLSIID